MAIRDIRLKILFELGYYESIYLDIDSYHHFLRNNKNLNMQMKNNYRTYLKFIRKLTDVVCKNKNRAEIKAMLDSSEYFSNKSWIAEKLA